MGFLLYRLQTCQVKLRPTHQRYHRLKRTDANSPALFIATNRRYACRLLLLPVRISSEGGKKHRYAKLQSEITCLCTFNHIGGHNTLKNRLLDSLLVFLNVRGSGRPFTRLDQHFMHSVAKLKMLAAGSQILIFVRIVVEIV